MTVTDPGCDAAPAPSLDVAGFNVGDADADGYLDDGETWTYTCSFVTGGHATPRRRHQHRLRQRHRLRR